MYRAATVTDIKLQSVAAQHNNNNNNSNDNKNRRNSRATTLTTRAEAFQRVADWS